MNVHKYTLQTTAHPGASRRLARAAITILADCFEGEDLLHDLDLALTEACANVVRHAYKDCDLGDLQIRLSISPGRTIELEIADWGPGFEAQVAEVSNADPEAHGGRGLFIISRLADEFQVKKRGNKTIVWMKKHIASDKWRISE